MLSSIEDIRRRIALAPLRRSDMHRYQFTGYQFMRENPFSALFIDMGMGKTVTSLTLACDLLSDFETDKVLIIGPLRVACETWPTEIRQWRHTAGFDHMLIRVDDDELRGVPRAAQAGEKQRLLRQKLKSTAPIHIINREQIEWLVEQFDEKRDWPYRTVIIDESSSFKEHSTKRFKALAKVRQAKGYITRMHLLTATPATESYLHLFAQMYLLDCGERLGEFISHYRRDYFDENRWTHTWTLKKDAEDQILEKISDICLVMKAEDYLDVKQPFFVEKRVQMLPRERELYDTLQEEMVVTLDDGSEIEAETAAALSSKLLQMASGVLYETMNFLDDATDETVKVKKVHPIHDHKIEMLKEIVETNEGKTFLVAYHFKSSLERLKKAFPKAVAMDKTGKAVKAWNAGKIPMLLVHPASAGHGLNLQHGGHNIVLFDIPWSLELFLQLVGRLARQGQKHLVTVCLLICENTLDELVWKKLKAKEDAQATLFAKLKRLIAKRRKERERLKALEDDEL